MLYVLRMRDDPTVSWFGDGEDPARHDPVRAARGAAARVLPKRFYSDVGIESVVNEPGVAFHRILLDARPALTKLRRPLGADTARAAELLRAEWAAQGEWIDPATMPVTRIIHAAIDHVSETHDEVAADILNYAASDLVCYRVADPANLVVLQAECWDPVLDHARMRYGARFMLSEGVRFVQQPLAALAALRPAVERHGASAARLAALHVLTTISGSALIAIAVADGALSAEAGFDAGEVDADYEVSIWGNDDEAAARRRLRRADFVAAAALLAALDA